LNTIIEGLWEIVQKKSQRLVRKAHLEENKDKIGVQRRNEKFVLEKARKSRPIAGAEEGLTKRSNCARGAITAHRRDQTSKKKKSGASSIPRRGKTYEETLPKRQEARVGPPKEIARRKRSRMIFGGSVA